MTNIKAIANRRSLVLKIDMSFLNSTYQERLGSYYYNGVVYPKGVYYILPSGSQYENIEEFGICYYTISSSNVTYIPFSSDMFIYHEDSQDQFGGKIWILPYTLKREGNLSVKVRKTPNYSVLCLLEGLTEGTTYHVSAYYKKVGGTPVTLEYSTVTTKSQETYKVTFAETEITTYPASEKTDIQNCKTMMDDILPKTAEMLNDCCNFTQNYNYNPILYWQVGGAGAYSDMRFNGWYLDTEDDIRTITTHELAHNYYKGNGVASGEFNLTANAIKFMEFATDIEGARIGRIGNHYYPVISSTLYDYIDDYLVCMSLDVDYLFGTNS